MPTQATTKPRYRVPSVNVDVDVMLDEFDIDDIRNYLANVDGRGQATGPGAVLIDGEDVGRIATIALCGQKEAARELVLQIVGDAIGRPL